MLQDGNGGIETRSHHAVQLAEPQHDHLFPPQSNMQRRRGRKCREQSRKNAHERDAPLQKKIADKRRSGRGHEHGDAEYESAVARRFLGHIGGCRQHFRFAVAPRARRSFPFSAARFATPCAFRHRSILPLILLSKLPYCSSYSSVPAARAQLSLQLPRTPYASRARGSGKRRKRRALSRRPSGPPRQGAHRRQSRGPLCADLLQGNDTPR